MIYVTIEIMFSRKSYCIGDKRTMMMINVKVHGKFLFCSKDNKHALKRSCIFTDMIEYLTNLINI